jgi:hypothetical protein
MQQNEYTCIQMGATYINTDSRGSHLKVNELVLLWQVSGYFMLFLVFRLLL